MNFRSLLRDRTGFSLHAASLHLPNSFVPLQHPSRNSPIMKLTIHLALPGGPQLLHQDFDPGFTIGDLKLILLDSNLPDDFPAHTWLLRHNQRVIGSDADSKSLAEVGISNDDILEATPNPTAAPPARPSEEAERADIERLRQHFVNNPDLQRDFLRSAPHYERIMHDPVRFGEIFLNQRRHFRRFGGDQTLNNDLDEGSQAQIYERIRREKIQKDFEDIVETSPELLGRVTMLYVNLQVNGVAVKAFVDSGAQATILSPSCAETCGITHLIDERWSGIARGVGTANILGRIHKAPVTIGYDELTCAFTVMEGKDVDMLLGLDMLKRYQASINLVTNCLEFPGGQSLPFLPENEIPRNFTEEPVIQGPAGTTMGAQSGQIKAPAEAGPSTASEPKKSNFQGAGQALGSAPSSASTPGAKQPAPAAPAAPAQQPAPQASRPAPAFPEGDIQTLLNIGASRAQAIAALQSCQGNVEIAASVIFDSL